VDERLKMLSMNKREALVNAAYDTIYAGVSSNIAEGKTEWYFIRTRHRDIMTEQSLRVLVDIGVDNCGSDLITSIVATKLRSLGLEVEVLENRFTVSWELV